MQASLVIIGLNVIKRIKEYSDQGFHGEFNISISGLDAPVNFTSIQLIK